MKDLLEKLEGLSAADRDIDEAIAIAITPPHPTRGKAVGMLFAPHYTSSLDVALRLIPDGLGWDRKNGRMWVGGHSAVGATPAIALCIAALKARNAQESRRGAENDAHVEAVNSTDKASGHPANAPDQEWRTGCETKM